MPVQLLLQRAAAAATGALLGIAVGLPLSEGNVLPAASALVLVAVIEALLRRLVTPRHLTRVRTIVLLAFALRLAAAASIYTIAVALGRGGFITGDDKGYAELAWGVAQYWKGTPDPVYAPPTWNNSAYFLGLFTYYESALFYVFGRQVLMAEFINAGFAAATLVLIFDLTRRLFDHRAAIAALVFTGFYPSLVLWSALNLKDAMVLLLITIAFRLLYAFQQRPSWLPLSLVFGLLSPIHELRAHVFFAVAATVAPAAAMVRHVRVRERIGWTAASAVVTGALMLNFGLADWLPVALRGFEAVRQGMAAGARTAFVGTPPAVVQTGDTFVVAEPGSWLPGQGIQASTATPSHGATGSPAAATATAPTPTPAIIHVNPGTRVVLLTAPPPKPTDAAPPPKPTDAVAFARPGDIVVVGGPSTTPRPGNPPPLQLTDLRDVPSVDILSQSDRESGVVQRTLAHVPRGIVYVLFAPFPWEIERPADALVASEMVLWYGLLVAATWAMWRARRRWRSFLPMLLYVLALLGLFVLIQGNLGILFRHRSMVVPAVVVLAGPGIAALVAWISRWSGARRAMGLAPSTAPPPAAP